MGEIIKGFENFKEWYKSKTIIGIIITLVSTLLKSFWSDVDLSGAVDDTLATGGDLAAQADSIWLSILQFVGLAVAFYGRIVAKLGIKKPGAA